MHGALKPTEASLSRAWYGASIIDFLAANPRTVLGTLSENSGFDILTTQRDAWSAQIEILRATLFGLTGYLFLEFNIPRMGRRIDAVVLLGPVIFAVEFKVGEEKFGRAAIEQVWDYALDLKNFHQASHAAWIVPVLVASEANQTSLPDRFDFDQDKVFRPINVSPAEIRGVIDLVTQQTTGPAVDETSWANAPYHPTPTIIEAARSLYAQHSVEAIARYDAGAKNLRQTSQRIEELVEEARAKKAKIICFVTGVPGAGKTLVGLNVATRRRDESEPTHAVFLSGNGPLVAVLREALALDEVERSEKKGEPIRKGEARSKVKAFIQNVHHFRDEALADSVSPPSEHVVIFDEAQRAWNLAKTVDFMRRKKGRSGFSRSEPDFLVSCLDRHKDWAVVVCLVGGGQEIHTGEAGIGEWLNAMSASFPDWQVYISSRLSDSEYAAGETVQRLAQSGRAHFDDALHLGVSMRSFRAEHVSAFVKALLDCEEEEARELFNNFRRRYPLALTRDLTTAKRWVRDHARGSERFGLLASSKAQRLKPHAIDIRVDVDPVQWFLKEKEHTRSSYYLEDAATEFQVQGLELDWACVTWDGDLRFTGSDWSFHDFRGDRWTNVNNADNRNHLRNAYRVLLTRARQGMVVFVQPGDPLDPTRSGNYYDPTFEYLAGLGIPVLDS